MQALQKQYQDIINAKCATGNTTQVYKPDYWEDMLMYFANRDGLSGQLAVNSSATKELLDLTTENSDSKTKYVVEQVMQAPEEETQDEDIQITQVAQVSDLDLTGTGILVNHKDGEDFETISEVERKCRWSSAASPANNSSIVSKHPKAKIDFGASISSLGHNLKDGMQAMATSLANRGSNQGLLNYIAKNQQQLIDVI